MTIQAQHPTGLPGVIQAYLHHQALRRCTRALTRSDAARERGNRAAAERHLARAVASLRLAQRTGRVA